MRGCAQFAVHSNTLLFCWSILRLHICRLLCDTSVSLLWPVWCFFALFGQSSSRLRTLGIYIWLLSVLTGFLFRKYLIWQEFGKVQIFGSNEALVSDTRFSLLGNVHGDIFSRNYITIHKFVKGMFTLDFRSNLSIRDHP